MNPPPKFVEAELTSVKGRREGEDNGIRRDNVDDISKQGRLIACTNKVGVVGVACNSPPVLVEGGREKPCRTKDWVRKVHGGNQGGNKANDLNVPLFKL